MDLQDLHTMIERLFRAHVDAVFNVAYRVVWNRADAEDVVQRSFLKAFTRLDQLNDVERSRPWLLQIAYRESLATIRGRREVATAPSALLTVQDPGRGPEDLAVAAGLADLVHTALAKINEDERIALVLRDIEGLPMQDVATVLGIGASAAKMRVHRGRAHLRQLLANTETV